MGCDAESAQGSVLSRLKRRGEPVRHEKSRGREEKNFGSDRRCDEWIGCKRSGGWWKQNSRGAGSAESCAVLCGPLKAAVEECADGPPERWWGFSD